MSFDEAKIKFMDIMKRKELVELFDDRNERFMFALGLRNGMLEFLDDKVWADFMDWSQDVMNDINGGFVFR